MRKREERRERERREEKRREEKRRIHRHTQTHTDTHTHTHTHIHTNPLSLSTQAKNEDAVKQFFIEVHELYVKVLLNPFYNENQRIRSAAFDSKVKAVAYSHLRGHQK